MTAEEKALEKIAELESRLATAEAQVTEARQFGEAAAQKYNDLLADQRILRCAFCDHEYPPETPPTQHEALEAHIRECSKHPLRVELATAQSRVRVLEELERDLDWLESIALNSTLDGHCVVLAGLSMGPRRGTLRSAVRAARSGGEGS